MSSLVVLMAAETAPGKRRLNCKFPVVSEIPGPAYFFRSLGLDCQPTAGS